jgi:L-fuculose-phosphate aldolase
VSGASDRQSAEPVPELLCLGEPMLELNRQESGLYLEGHGGDTSNAAIYAARPEAAAIVHTHSPMATALSCARVAIPPFHYMIALGGGATIPCARYATFGTAALAEACIAALTDRKATLLANHGVVALGKTLAGAVTLAREVENLARQYLALRGAGLEPVLLAEAELAEVFAQFGDYGRIA